MSARSHWFASLRYSSRNTKLSNKRSRPPLFWLMSWMIWCAAQASVCTATSSPPWNHSDMATRNCRRAASSLVMVIGSGSDPFILGAAKGDSKKSRSLIELVLSAEAGNDCSRIFDLPCVSSRATDVATNGDLATWLENWHRRRRVGSGARVCPVTGDRSGSMRCPASLNDLRGRKIAFPDNRKILKVVFEADFCGAKECKIRGPLRLRETIAKEFDLEYIGRTAAERVAARHIGPNLLIRCCASGQKGEERKQCVWYFHCFF
jgi:hypothetical protein